MDRCCCCQACCCIACCCCQAICCCSARARSASRCCRRALVFPVIISHRRTGVTFTVIIRHSAVPMKTRNTPRIVPRNFHSGQASMAPRAPPPLFPRLFCRLEMQLAYTRWITPPQLPPACLSRISMALPLISMIKVQIPTKLSRAKSHGRTGARRWVDQITSPPAHRGSTASTYARLPVAPTQTCRRPWKMFPGMFRSTAMKISTPSAASARPAIYRRAMVSAEYAGACFLLPCCAMEFPRPCYCASVMPASIPSSPYCSCSRYSPYW